MLIEERERVAADDVPLGLRFGRSHLRERGLGRRAWRGTIGMMPRNANPSTVIAQAR